MKKILTIIIIAFTIPTFAQKFKVGDTVEVKESFLKRNHATKAEYTDAVIAEVFNEKIGWKYRVEVEDKDSTTLDETIHTGVIREINLRPKKK